MSELVWPVVRMANGRPAEVMLLADERSAHHWVRRNPGWVQVKHPVGDRPVRYVKSEQGWNLEL